MKIPFSKYQGTGNDFIIIDNRKLNWIPTKEEIAFLCDRHFGIGADGLMLMTEEEGYDFQMTYYNSDGRESTMCGNGGRCMIIFARSAGLIGSDARFLATDGEHSGKVIQAGSGDLVSLKMKDVTVDEVGEDYLFLNTGSPHYVVFKDDVEMLDVISEARKIRFNDRFRQEGTNVDFVEVRDAGLFVRSYERGVEDETLSCGTGVTASVLARAVKSPGEKKSTEVQTRGGKLSVSFHQEGQSFTDIWLTGPATFVYQGEVDI
ncbi:MAG: diaminopimelate epimerase [Bacteroidetes bacterium]|nr:diaminopimelate epimerase [Bacteroidota bacterium]